MALPRLKVVIQDILQERSQKSMRPVSLLINMGGHLGLNMM